MLGEGEEINPQLMAQDSIVFILSGRVSEYSNNLKLRSLNENEIYWGIIHEVVDGVALKGETASILMVLSPELIFNTMSEIVSLLLTIIGLLSKTA